MAILIILSRFIYVFYLGDNDVKGNFFGFTWLSSFLYTAGIELAFLSFAFILWYATKFMDYDHARPFRYLSYLITFVGLFFLSWVAFEDKGFSLFQEVFFSLISSLIALTLGIWMYRFADRYLARGEFLKSKIRFLLDFIFDTAVEKGYIKDELRDEYDEDIEEVLEQLNT
jgi:hypothetical protein